MGALELASMIRVRWSRSGRWLWKGDGGFDAYYTAGGGCGQGLLEGRFVLWVFALGAVLVCSFMED